MKNLYTLAVVLFIISGASAQSITTPPNGDNQKAIVTQFIGPVEVSISYHSPNVHGGGGKDRTGHIWGELVHNGYIDQGFGPAKAAPWRAGANENTVIHFSHDVVVEGKPLKAGDYGLFLATQKTGPWTWVFSKNSASWGSYFYDQNEDALRVDVSPADGAYTEYLTYGFEDRKPASTLAVLSWENKKIPLKIEVPNVNEVYVSIIRNELRNSPGFDSRNYTAAAQFCAQNKINLEEALKWANIGTGSDPNLGGTEDFTSLKTKADVLTAMGKDTEAEVVLEKAIKHPTASVMNVHFFGRQLLAAGKNQKALEIFQYNAKTHPEEKFTTYVGLARGYTAVGDKKNAIKNWQIAIKNIPDNAKVNLPQYEEELKKLQSK